MPLNNHNDLDRLKEILASRSLSTSGNFTLHSGEKSAVYVDGKLTTLIPEAMPLVGRAFLGKMQERGWTPEAGLVSNVLASKVKATDIKKAIVTWRADMFRV